MSERLQTLVAWFGGREVLLGTLGGLSLLTFFGTLLAIPWLVRRIPEDYFLYEVRPPAFDQRHPLILTALAGGKNLLGFVLVLAGIAMLVLPGQGLLTILIGLMLMNFPRKYRLERWLVSRPGVLRAMNWIRRRSGRSPLQYPEPAAERSKDA